MRCSNCGAPIPRGATSCPSCGVYARDEPPKPPLPPRRNWWPLAALVVVLAAGGTWWWFGLPERKTTVTRGKPTPVHVVRDRPGGNASEAEAIRALRSYLVERGTPADCVAIISNGLHGGAYQLTALDRCKNIKLGPWSVDAKTHEVKMR